jgi:site-specific recombinase XerD
MRTLRRAGLAAKGPVARRLTFYSLRHSFAADLVTIGRPLKHVADLLGNSVRTCELHYTHLLPGNTLEAVQSLKAAEPWPTRTASGENASPEVVIPGNDDVEAA